MILQALSAGILSGYFNAFLRAALIQLSIKDGYLCISTYVYIMIVIPTAFLKLVIYNNSMAMYDQSENGPIFAAFFILIQIISGAILLNEGVLYNTFEMVQLTFYSSICIMGIYILANKPVQTEFMEKDMLYYDSQD